MNDIEGAYLGRYQVIEQLGRGGMAAVYKAFDTQLERYVAIKVLLQNQAHSEQFFARFQREAKTLAMLSHPHIVKVLDYGEYESMPFLVMEYLPGGNMATYIPRPFPLHWRKAAQMLVPIATALHYAHLNGVIHRDVKPSNILLTSTGQPMLSDFGIAKILQIHETMDLTHSGVGIGTPEYMAPEQGTGVEVDFRVDIYSLGVVFYELVTGRRPYTADTPLGVLLKQHSDPLPQPSLYLPDLPEDVERFIFKMMAKDPDQRYRSMNEVADILDKIALDIPLTKEEAPPVIPVTQAVPQRLFSSWVSLFAGLGGVALLGILGVLIFSLVRGQEPQKIITITGGLEGEPAVEFASISGVSGQVEVISADGEAVPIESNMKLLVAGPFRLKSVDGEARLTLVGGSVICIPPQTELEFFDINTTNPYLPEFNLNMKSGRLLFIDSSEMNSHFAVKRPLPVTISSRGAIIGVEKTGNSTPRLDLDCLAGACTFDSQPIRMDLTGSGHIAMETAGRFSSVEDPHVDRWSDVCTDLIYQRVAGVPAPTPRSLVSAFSHMIMPLIPPSSSLVDPLPQATITPTATRTVQLLAGKTTPTPSNSKTDKREQPTPTATKMPSPTPTSTGKPAPIMPSPPSPTPTQTDTPTPQPTRTFTPEPTSTDTPQPTSTDTPVPSDTPTDEPVPTATFTEPPPPSNTPDPPTEEPTPTESPPSNTPPADNPTPATTSVLNTPEPPTAVADMEVSATMAPLQPTEIITESTPAPAPPPTDDPIPAEFPAQ